MTKNNLYRSKLKIHIRNKHGEEEVQKAFPPKIIQGEYSCHVCQHKTNFKSKLKIHIRRKHGEKEVQKAFPPKIIQGIYNTGRFNSESKYFRQLTFSKVN